MKGVNWDVLSDFRPGASRSRHPFEVFTLFLALSSGLTITLGGTNSSALEQALPDWAEVVWGFTLTGGSTLALLGVWWRKRVTGIIIEQIGLAMVGFATVLYGLCILTYAGFAAGGLSATYVLGFGLSCLWRWIQLERLIQILHQLEQGDLEPQ